MNSKHKQLLINNKWLFFVPLILGAAIAILMTILKPGAQEKQITEESIPLRVIQVPISDLVPRALGYGVVEPQQIWRAISRVEGFIEEVNPALRSGGFVNKNELLIKIDPTAYEIEIDKLNAEIAKNNASLAQLKSQQANDRLSLKIEEESLLVSKRELTRKEKLLNQKVISQADLDAQRNIFLKQQQSVQLLQNKLNLVPSQEHSINAELKAYQASLQAAKLELSYTEMKAPFDARIAEVNLQMGQYLAPGEELFEAFSNNAIEIEAQVSFAQLQNLLTPEQSQAIRYNINFSQPPGDQVISSFLKTNIKYTIGNDSWSWNGHILRVREAVDATTHSYSVVVAVDDPNSLNKKGKRPILIKGVFSEVEFLGRLLKNQVLVPLSSLHRNTVYLIDENNRLQKREIKVGFKQGSFAVITQGLIGGETLVVSPPTTAIIGLLVQPSFDDNLPLQLIEEASPEGSLE